MARVGEINRLTWDDVNLEERYVILYTRKKKGGHLTPRKIPMTQRLHEILERRYAERIGSIPSVFWHKYWSRKSGRFEIGSFERRKRLLKGLCKKAGVRPFGFHALRHSGASLLENNNVPVGVIQKVLGHENRSTTEIYLHNLGISDREAMALLEQSCRKKSHTQHHDSLSE
jgi:integrase